MRFSRLTMLGVIWAAAVTSPLLAAEVGTAFTYQGSLENGSGPVTDTCAFEFALCDDAAATCAPGTVSSHPAVAVTDGVFTVPDVDFGDGLATAKRGGWRLGSSVPAMRRSSRSPRAWN